MAYYPRPGIVTRHSSYTAGIFFLSRPDIVRSYRRSEPGAYYPRPGIVAGVNEQASDSWS